MDAQFYFFTPGCVVTKVGDHGISVICISFDDGVWAEASEMLKLLQHVTAIKNGNFCFSDLISCLNLVIDRKIGLSKDQLRQGEQRGHEDECQRREGCLTFSPFYKCHTSETTPTLLDSRSVCFIPEDKHFLHHQLMQQSLGNNRAGQKFLRQVLAAVNSVVKCWLVYLG